MVPADNSDDTRDRQKWASILRGPDLGDAVDALRAGGLVAFPTETVYGLGADASNARAVAALYRAKGRPSFNPLIAHVADRDAAARRGVFNADAEKLAAAFWPGPLTLVLPKTADCDVCDLATAGLDSIALRVPRHAIAQQLLAQFEGPIVAPSANKSGRVSPTTVWHVADDLRGDIDVIIDGGAVKVGVESTIVSCHDAPTLLRPGGVPRETIEAVLGRPLVDPASDSEAAPRAPGRLASHYAPHCPLRMNATDAAEDEALLAFGAVFPNAARAMMNLSEAGDLDEAAANLFNHLRALDAQYPSCIAVMPVPTHGLGEAINDRLRRAAAPRDAAETMSC